MKISRCLSGKFVHHKTENGPKNGIKAIIDNIIFSTNNSDDFQSLIIKYIDTASDPTMSKFNIDRLFVIVANCIGKPNV